MFLLYQYRSRESEVDEGKDEKKSQDCIIPTHFFVGRVCGLDAG